MKNTQSDSGGSPPGLVLIRDGKRPNIQTEWDTQLTMGFWEKALIGLAFLMLAAVLAL